MNIINFKKLSRNPFRQKALLIAEAGYKAIEIEKVVQQRIKIKRNQLFIFNPAVRSNTITRDSIASSVFKFDLNRYKKIFLVGIGKGSALASASLVKILGNRLTGGIALDIQKPKFKIKNLKLKILVGTHPLPSKRNIKATQKIIKLVKNLKKDDLLVTFICGGGSALLCGSEKELKNSILATELLTQAGANILELNTVREHLSDVKGGGLAKLAYPATVVSLIVSDVLGNDLFAVASGPTVFNKTAKKDAEKIWGKYQSKEVRLPNIAANFRKPDFQKLEFIETPKDKKYFAKVKNILFLSNREPILAMAEKAKELGFKPKIYSFNLNGEAKNVLPRLIKNVPRVERAAILAGGETTVALMNKELGIMNNELEEGGRNMESVLGALNSLHNSYFILHNSVILSFASDGRDNTEAAGAIGDILTIQRAQRLKLNPQKYLNSHATFNFFKKTRDLIFTEQKTFNVADLMIILKL